VDALVLALHDLQLTFDATISRGWRVYGLNYILFWP
jgi:hypothetical protein